MDGQGARRDGGSLLTYVECLESLYHAVDAGGGGSDSIDGRSEGSDREDNALQRSNHRADVLLHVAQTVGRSLRLSGWRLTQGFVHATDRGFDNLGQYRCTLLFRAELQDLLLRLVEGVAIAREGGGLPLHHLAEHGGHLCGALLGRFEAVLLCQHIVHDGDEGFEGGLLFQVRCQFLGTGQLHLVTYYTQFLLSRAEVLDALDLLLARAHCVAHVVGEARLIDLLGGVGVGEVEQRFRQFLYATGGVLEGFGDVVECQEGVAEFLPRILSDSDFLGELLDVIGRGEDLFLAINEEGETIFYFLCHN